MLRHSGDSVSPIYPGEPDVTFPDYYAQSDPPPAQDWPAYWLVCLERALAEGEYTAAADAQRELRRLGIDVAMRLLPYRGASCPQS